MSSPDVIDAETAREFLESARWPMGPECPHCGLRWQAYRLKPRQPGSGRARPGLWKCVGCRKQFTVTVGTILEDSRLPLGKWLLAIRLFCGSQNGLTASRIQSSLRVAYQTARFLIHRIRYAMTQEPLLSKLQACHPNRGRLQPRSLFPMEFDEALPALLKVPPEKRVNRLEALDRQEVRVESARQRLRRPYSA